MDPKGGPDRITFVLQCWPERDGQRNVITWRFALENVITRQQHGFAGTAGLLEFIQNELHVSEVDSNE